MLCGSQMLLECSQLEDALLELRVRAAMASNRLVRMENPILRAKLRGAQVRMDAAIAATAAAATADGAGSMELD